MEPLERAVAGELARFGADAGLAPIVEAWPSAVGPDIARNAWPARLSRSGTLVVHTSSAAWTFELAQLESQVRGRLAEPRPARLRFVVGPLPEPTPAEDLRPARCAPEPSPRDLDTGAAIAAPIVDENLRKLVAKAIALSLARASSDRSLW
jgi:Dna[CI] antecedent DciA-like protein